MLLGEYEHTLDDKNRLTLPAKFRQALADGVVVARGMDGCIAVYTAHDWERLVETRLDELDPLSKETRQMRRFMFSGASEAELDRQGRTMIPPALVQHAQLKREVVVAGMRDHVEIWERARWREQLKEVEGSVELVAERIAAKQD